MLDDVRVRIALSGSCILLYIACLLVVFLRNPAAYLDVFAGLCGRVGIRERANDAPEAAGRQQGRVTKAVGELRAQYFLGTAQLWMHIVAARLIYTFGTNLIGLETTGRGSGYAAQCLGILFLISLLLTLRPGLVNPRTLPFLFYLCHGMMLCLGVLAATAHAGFFVKYQASMLLTRISISLAYPVASPNACINAVWVVLSTYAHLRTEPVLLLEQSVDRIVTEILSNCFLSYWLWQFESLQTGQVRSESKATMYFIAKKTMERLLADMCDAVVELGPELEIKEPCPKLASLLLKHGNATALAGERFTHLTFGKEDQDHFEARAFGPKPVWGSMGNGNGVCKPDIHRDDDEKCVARDSSVYCGDEVPRMCAAAVDSSLCREPWEAPNRDGNRRGVLNASLIAAARAGDANALQIVLMKGADVETRRPMQMARTDDFKNGQVKKIARDVGMTPLMHACLAGSSDCVSLLLEAKANPNASDEDGVCPLHFAASYGAPALGALLLGAGAMPGVRDHEMRGPMDYLSQDEDQDTIIMWSNMLQNHMSPRRMVCPPRRAVDGP